MTAESSSTSHLSAAMTTAQDDVTQATGESTLGSSSSRGAEFYFCCAVIVLGIVGIVANALILYALVASKQHKKQVLIVNQNALDLASCSFLAVTYALKISNVSLTGRLGYWLCVLLLSENLLWWAIEGSVINLILITIERYLKVVHPIWAKKKLRRWMTYLATAFPWAISLIINMSMTLLSSAVIGGVCHALSVFEDPVAKLFHAIFYVLTFYVGMLLIFIFCYGRILVTIRRQASVMAGHGTVGTAHATATQAHAHQIHSNVVKTMIIVCAFYAIAWLPENVYYLLVNVLQDGELTLAESSYYAVVFIAFLYICMNPFLYAAKFDPVKRILLSMIACSKDDQPPHTIELRTASTRTVQQQ